MKQQIFTTLIFLLSALSIGICQQGPVGWAATNGGTTGGQGGETVIAETRNEFVAYVASSDPLIVRIRDTIELNLYERVKVQSNKTIIGITVNAMLRYGGLEIEGDNVIVRNLIIRDSYDGDWSGKTHSTDAITITGTNVWVDHCWLAASADGLLDIRSNNPNQVGDLVTVSYTRFTDHNKVSLIGSSNDSEEDRDHLKTTFHHCWFDGTVDKGLNQRLPRIRYGDIHLFNNYFEDVASYCILARYESDVVVENNYFRNSNNPHGLQDFGLGQKDPELVASGNIYEFSGGNKNSSGDAFTPADFYDYELMDALQIPAHVMNEAGPFNNPGNADPVAETDQVFLEEGERSFELDLTENDTDEDSDDLRIGAILNETDGAILIRNNVARYIAPANPEKSDTVMYELVDTEGGYAMGMLIVDFEGVVSSAYEALELEGLKIFPNPASDWIQLEFSHSQLDQFVVQVSDLLGRPHYRKQISTPGGDKYQLRIPCSDWNPGYKVISIIDGNSASNYKILIQ